MLIVLAVVLCFGSDALAYVRLGQRQQNVLSGIEDYRSNPAINCPQSDPEIRNDVPEEDEFERATLTRAIAGMPIRCLHIALLVLNPGSMVSNLQPGMSSPRMTDCQLHFGSSVSKPKANINFRRVTQSLH